MIRTRPATAAVVPLAAFVIAAAGLAVQPAAGPVDPNQPPTTRTATCTDGGCHAQQMEYQFLHAPVAVGACEVCHTYEDPVQHTFIHKHEGAAMCDFCHIGKSAPGDAMRGRAAGTARDLGEFLNGRPLLYVHEPVTEGDCTACHNPHGSNVRQLVRGDSVGALCSSCHESASSHAYMHTPAKEGDCTSCHRPHSSIHPNLLVQQGRDLCVSCHADAVHPMGTASGLWSPSPLAALRAVRHEVTARRLTHRPVLEDCSQCHDAHGTAHPGLLTQEIGSLCGSCHEDVYKTASMSQVHHPAVSEQAACLNCHSPHHAPNTHLLRDAPVQICLDCHADPISRDDGSRIAGLSSLLDTGVQLHGPLADGRCQGCHQVHGGSRTSLLSANYSPEFYQSFTPDAYELCFTCHNAELASLARTTSATNFRNGDVNLHFVHVSGQDESGRSCRLCHAPHAGPAFPRLHEKVDYGQWQLPLEYQATDSGGTCDAGCHRPRAYDRYTPVLNEEPARR